ncbi:MAG: beta-lactamase, partial [Pseudomonadota bacterium]|nr:beta-lactamase [Pseudomonadota bacterium]
MILPPKHLVRAALALACACSFPIASAAADDDAALRSTVDAAMRAVMAEHDVPGMAVAVTVNGQVYFFNYGVASREQHAAVSEHTVFELGSVSKTFAATLAGYAQEQGILSLDDHPGKYLPQLRGSAIDKASLLHLGTYTAGGLTLQVPDGISTMPQMMAYFAHWKPDAAPGAVRRYSNPSIGLFGHITALAMKSDFAAAAETVLFPQLGLRHTYVIVPASAQADYAWGYNKANKAIRVNPDVFDAEAYGVKSSAADMIHFVQENIAPGQLAAPMRRAVEATQVGYFEVGAMVQGLGWEQYPYPATLERLLDGNSQSMAMDANPARRLSAPRMPAGPTLFNKTGSTGGFGSYVLFVPAKKIGIVMLANRNYPNAARVKAAYA